MARVLSFYNIPVEGEKVKIICPFHDDLNASMLIDVDDNRFFCFGCEKHGDARSFHIGMQKLLNKDKGSLQADIEYNKIIKGIKGSTKQSVTKQRRNKIKDAKEKEQYLIEAKDYYYGLKTIDWEQDDSEERYYMEWRGFDANTLNESKSKHTYNDNYPIIFPMLDNDDFKGWVCRTTDRDIQKKRKYLYNKGFSRRNTLAGSYRRTRTVMLVEGYMDMLKAKQHGYAKVCAILGWKITLEQVDKLKKQGVINVISALDNDECGRKGNKHLEQFFDVYAFKYPENVKDIGDISKIEFKKAVRETKEEMKNVKKLNCKD